MGPMGPMMGGWRGAPPAMGGWPSASWDAGWLVPALALLLVLILALVAVALITGRTASAREGAGGPRPAAEVLRERYARGELTREQYRETLVDILKDRYVRGEVDLESYEAQLGLVLREESPRSGDGRSPALGASPAGQAPVRRTGGPRGE